MIEENLSGLLLAYSTYLIGTISPGPANMAIMGTSMESGRQAGLVLALGVICGSLCWGIAAALGFAAIFSTYKTAFIIMKIVAGLYLLWLGWKAAKTALSSAGTQPRFVARDDLALRQYFLRGFAIHITNPKAIIVWAAVITVGASSDAAAASVFKVVGGCAFLGILVFTGYAMVFSSAAMVRSYTRMRSWIQGGMAAMFGFAGINLLLSRS